MRFFVQFVSGATWDVESLALPLPDQTGFWEVTRFDRQIPQGCTKSEYVSMGNWLINMANVEAIKES